MRKNTTTLPVHHSDLPIEDCILDIFQQLVDKLKQVIPLSGYSLSRHLYLVRLYQPPRFKLPAVAQDNGERCSELVCYVGEKAGSQPLGFPQYVPAPRSLSQGVE